MPDPGMQHLRQTFSTWRDRENVIMPLKDRHCGRETAEKRIRKPGSRERHLIVPFLGCKAPADQAATRKTQQLSSQTYSNKWTPAIKTFLHRAYFLGNEGIRTVIVRAHRPSERDNHVRSFKTQTPFFPNLQ
jgi:hypothetical protein